ncbi:hypothetical protein LT493_15305 [Streptomyces tricolor]|nr:hypothetical protein [Streptomyces tricolor]
MQRLQSNDQVAETLARDLAAAGVDAVVVVLYAVLLYTYDPQLTFVGIAVALLNVVAMRLVVRLRATRTAKLRADTARLTNTSYTGLQLIETLKATGGEDGYFRKWAGQHATTLEEQQRLGVPSAWLGVVAPTLRHLQQRAHPVDRRAARGRGAHLGRSAGRVPGAGHPLHRPR